MIGFVGRFALDILNAIRRPFQRRGRSLTDSSLANWLGGSTSTTTSGANVTEDTALNLVSVYACVRILAETVGSLPLFVYRRLDERGKEVARKHPLFRLLHRRPNPYMTSFTFRETMMGHLALRGNAYAEKVFNGAGDLVELWPMRPDRVEPIWEGDALFYDISIPGEATLKRVPASRILHLRGFGGDGITGYSPIRIAREAIGLAMSSEEFGARFFGNGSRPGGFLKHPSKLTPEAASRLKQSWEKVQGGLSNSNRVAVLEEGIEWIKVGIDPDDAQFLETRRFQLAEIARLFRVPLHLLQELQNASYATVEQQGIDFTVHSIRPWCERIEQEYLLQLFTEADQDEFFPKHKIDGLLRGDQASRFTSYATARQWGWMSVNDILELEDRNPIGPEGDVYLQPLNMVTAGTEAEPTPPKMPSDPLGDAPKAPMATDEDDEI